MDESNPARGGDAFVDLLDLADLGFETRPEATGRPGFHPGMMLRLYIYGYLNRIQSSCRLEPECGRNLELLWLTGGLQPDFKTIADFRKDKGPAIRKVCQHFVLFCREISSLDAGGGAIDGSRFGQAGFAYLADEDAYRCPAGQRLTYRFTGQEDGKTMRVYWCGGLRRLRARAHMPDRQGTPHSPLGP